MMTEKEARKKWCPHVRHEDNSATFNRGTAHGPLNDHPGNAGTLCNCIASGCMSWRWTHRDNVGGPFADTTEPHVYWLGYCGLAGKP